MKDHATLLEAFATGASTFGSFAWRAQAFLRRPRRRQEAINIAGGRGSTILELARVLLELSGSRSPIVHGLAETLAWQRRT